jgi:hypothetical protein
MSVASIWFENWGALGSPPSPLLRKRPETTPSTSKSGGHEPPTPRIDMVNVGLMPIADTMVNIVTCRPAASGRHPTGELQPTDRLFSLQSISNRESAT